MHGVGAQSGSLKTLEQRTKLLGVRDYVPGVVQCHPTAPEAFNELSLHSVNSTSASPSWRTGSLVKSPAATVLWVLDG